jgi:hypothetical protein
MTDKTEGKKNCMDCFNSYIDDEESSCTTCGKELLNWLPFPPAKEERKCNCTKDIGSSVTVKGDKFICPQCGGVCGVIKEGNIEVVDAENRMIDVYEPEGWEERFEANWNNNNWLCEGTITNRNTYKIKSFLRAEITKAVKEYDNELFAEYKSFDLDDDANLLIGMKHRKQVLKKHGLWEIAPLFRAEIAEAVKEYDRKVVKIEHGCFYCGGGGMSTLDYKVNIEERKKLLKKHGLGE